MSHPPDFGIRIGMPVAFLRSDLEEAVEAICSATEIDGIGIHVAHLAPDRGAPVTEGHAAAVRGWVAARGLAVSTLNATGDPSFEPAAGREELRKSAELIAGWLRLGSAMGAPRVMIWDGVASTPEASADLARAIELGRSLSRLHSPPPISVELHPFTFALAHDRVEELAQALRRVGDAGFCFDFAHCAVALGAEFIGQLPRSFFDLIVEVHWCDSDAMSSELHFPPGDGALDIELIEIAYAGRAVPVLWDIYGWPAPRDALARTSSRYAAAVERHRRSVG